MKISNKIKILTPILLCASLPALADGMPATGSLPAPTFNASLDQSIQAIQNKDPMAGQQQAQAGLIPQAQAQQPAPAGMLPQPGLVTPAAAQTTDPNAPLPIVPDLQPGAGGNFAPVPLSRVVETQPESAFFGLSVGMYDAFTNGDEAASLNLEYHPGVQIAGFLQPILGATVSSTGAILGYAGFGVPVPMGDHWMMMPSLAVGAYEKGDGVDLEKVLAFRAGAEFAYVFDDKSRLGLSAHVITNGMSDQPKDRTEVVGLSYTMPFRDFFDRRRK